MKMQSVDVGKELEGSTPPSVFIGSWNYPKVYAGPMIAPLQGDTTIMDTPESWIPQEKTQEDIIGYRLNLVRGKQLVGIRDLENNFVEKLQEISLASNSIDSEAEFGKKPRGFSFSDEHGLVLHLPLKLKGCLQQPVQSHCGSERLQGLQGLSDRRKIHRHVQVLAFLPCRMNLGLVSKTTLSPGCDFTFLPIILITPLYL